MFNEENTVEQMALDTIQAHGWRFVAAEELPRQHSDVLVESMVRDALIRLNPETKAQPDLADEVIQRIWRHASQTRKAYLSVTNFSGYSGGI